MPLFRRYLVRWRWAVLALAACTLLLIFVLLSGQGPYPDRSIPCPPDAGIHCHDIAALPPYAPWAVAAWFLGIVVILVVAQRLDQGRQRLRAEFVAGAEAEWRKRTGRPMTAEELERVLMLRRSPRGRDRRPRS